MRDNILNEVIKVNDYLVVPGYIVKNYSKLDLEGYNLIVLLYFINQKNNITFDVNKISNDLNIDSAKLLEIINELNEKNYISIEMKKNNGVIEEFISTELFYNKISSILIDRKKEDNESDIYSLFEKEFGRTLGPTEISTISKWVEGNISEEMIKEALKEAVLSGVCNMRYIDSILLRWSKNGYKNIEDIKRKKDNNEEIEAIYTSSDFDWVNELE